MPFYTCDHHRKFRGESWSEVAQHFAYRKAVEEFGRCARVGACRVTRHAADSSMFRVKAFIGRRAPDGGTTGHNIYFTVTRTDA